MNPVFFNFLCISLLSLFLIEAFTVNLHIIISILWLKRKKHTLLNVEQSVNLYLIIPILDEMELIESAIEHFDKISSKYPNRPYVCFVTSQREYNINGNVRNTITILKQKIKTQNLDIVHYHYPKTNGLMADQINFGINQIRKHDSSDFLVGIYNVDSRLEDLEYSKILQLHKEKKESRHVLQQYSYYENSILKCKYSLMSEACLWQTRWSLGFELGRVRYNQILNFFFKKLPNTKFLQLIKFVLEKFNYTIGHGAFFNSNILDKQNPFPTYFYNEDAYWGYELALRKIDISPIRTLETVHFTSSLTTYIKQQAVWFNGPLSAFKYFIHYNTQKKLTFSEMLRALLISFKLFLHALYWLFSPYIVLFLLPLFLYQKQFEIVSTSVYCFALILYIWLPNKIISYHFKERKPPKSFFPLGLIFYLVHTFGPIYCLCNLIFFRKGHRKIKTKKMAYEY